MKISIAVAAATNGVIGKDNQLVWYLPNDLRRFKQLTYGHPIIMGRKTFESIGKPLPGRTSIIITRQQGYAQPGCIVVHGIEEALHVAESLGATEVFVIGGAEIYHQALPITDTIYMTEVCHSFEGDTYFPVLDSNQWQEVHREAFSPDEKNRYAYAFVKLTHIRK